MAVTVLVVDDDPMIRSYLDTLLSEDGYEVLSAATGGDGLALVETQPVDVVILDLMLPDTDGLSVLEKARELEPGVPVILLTAHGAVSSAVKAMKLGAYDYITKPFDNSKLKLTVRRALDELNMRREIQRLRQRPGLGSYQWIVGSSERMRNIERVVEKVATSNATILIQGESGTGKEVVAHAIQQRGPRADRPFVVINCAAIPEGLLESEMFGYEAGAFTGARRRKKGLLEMADTGTLFLDEITEMKPGVQAKILRVLETKTLRRIGGTTDIKVDVRFIAASNRDLQAAVREGMLREDLYYRLGVVEIHLPPLRERLEDLELFISAFVGEFNQSMGKDVRGVSGEALECLRRYRWPGNIRELRNVIERAMVLCDDRLIQPAHLPPDLVCASPGAVVPRGSSLMELPAEGVDLVALVSELEQRLIRQALARTGGNQSEAAQLLAMSRDQLRYRIEKYNLS